MNSSTATSDCLDAIHNDAPIANVKKIRLPLTLIMTHLVNSIAFPIAQSFTEKPKKKIKDRTRLGLHYPNFLLSSNSFK